SDGDPQRQPAARRTEAPTKPERRRQPQEQTDADDKRKRPVELGGSAQKKQSRGEACKRSSPGQHRGGEQIHRPVRLNAFSQRLARPQIKRKATEDDGKEKQDGGRLTIRDQDSEGT